MLLSETQRHFVCHLYDAFNASHGLNASYKRLYCPGLNVGPFIPFEF